MKRKIIAGIFIFSFIVIVIAVLTSCDGKGLDSESGKDKYGRDYGSIYDIDEYQDGIYSLEYAIEDTSAMGKNMIGSYCYDRVKLAASNDGYELTFYCKNTTFSDVKLNDEAGQSIEESNMYGYRFALGRDDLNGKLAMTGRVSLMNKNVAFFIKADLTKATLIGNNAINESDTVSGNN